MNKVRQRLLDRKRRAGLIVPPLTRRGIPQEVLTHQVFLLLVEKVILKNLLERVRNRIIMYSQTVVKLIMEAANEQ